MSTGSERQPPRDDGEAVRSLLFVVRGGDTIPSCRFRAYQYREPLEALGIRVGFLLAERSDYPWRQLAFLLELRREARRYDAVIYQKLLRPWHLRTAASANPNVFYDFDDALYVSESESRFARTLRAAPRVLAGNALLAEHASRYNQAVQIVPTTVVLPSSVEAASPSGPFRLSWIGTADNLRYLVPVRAALSRLRTAGHDIRLSILTEAPERAPQEDGMEVERWSRAAESAAMARCEVGLMPLVDEPWSRGKCACKALQYLSYARPVITSPVGMNQQLFTGKPYARMPAADAEWDQAILDYLAQRADLARLGQLGRSMVAEDYSVQVWAPRLARLLRANTR